MKVLRYHVGHTTIIHCPFPSAFLLRKLAINNIGRLFSGNPSMITDQPARRRFSFDHVCNKTKAKIEIG